MTHMQEAYEALVDKLNAKFEDTCVKHQCQLIDNMKTERVLLDFIFEHHGKKVLMELAKDVDDKLKRKNDYTQFIDSEYED